MTGATQKLGLSLDPAALNALRTQAQNAPQAALKTVAKQFEAVFLNMMLKSMRDTVSQDGMFDNEQTKMFNGMLDEQYASQLSQGRGLGLADMIVRQMSQAANVGALSTGGVDGAAGAAGAAAASSVNSAVGANSGLNGAAGARGTTGARSVRDWGGANAATGSSAAAAASANGGPGAPGTGATSTGSGNAPAGAADGGGAGSGGDGNTAINPGSNTTGIGGASGGSAGANPVAPAAHAGPAAFKVNMAPHAAAASEASGIPAHFMIAQAGLESGWGQHQPRTADGQPSHNLFGIKAGSNWHGPVVNAETTEMVNGVARRVTQPFRAYGSYAEAFQDYASLLSGSARYARVLGASTAQGFAGALQKAGYATDPAYATKLERAIRLTGDLRA